MMAMFIMGSTLVLGVGTEAEQDAWLAVIISIIFAAPVIAMYARILSLFPGNNLYEILNMGGKRRHRGFGQVVAADYYASCIYHHCRFNPFCNKFQL